MKKTLMGVPVSRFWVVFFQSHPRSGAIKLHDYSACYPDRTARTKVYLETSEVENLEKRATNLRDRLLIRLLFHLGCRISEALALQAQDVDFGQGTVVIQHLKCRVKLS